MSILSIINSDSILFVGPCDIYFARPQEIGPQTMAGDPGNVQGFSPSFTATNLSGDFGGGLGFQALGRLTGAMGRDWDLLGSVKSLEIWINMGGSMGVPQQLDGFRENPIDMDDLGLPPWPWKATCLEICPTSGILPQNTCLLTHCWKDRKSRSPMFGEYVAPANKKQSSQKGTGTCHWRVSCIKGSAGSFLRKGTFQWQLWIGGLPVLGWIIGCGCPGPHGVQRKEKQTKTILNPSSKILLDVKWVSWCFMSLLFSLPERPQFPCSIKKTHNKTHYLHELLQGPVALLSASASELLLRGQLELGPSVESEVICTSWMESNGYMGVS